MKKPCEKPPYNLHISDKSTTFAPAIHMKGASDL